MQSYFKYILLFCIIVVFGCTSQDKLLPKPEYYTESERSQSPVELQSKMKTQYSFLYSLSFKQYQDYYRRFGGFLPVISQEEAIISMLQLDNDPHYNITIIINYLMYYCNENNLDIETIMKNALEQRLKGD